MITVNRKYRFCASHRLHVPSLGEEENAELFGKCNNPFGHGHNYEIELSVEGPIEQASGRAVDPAALDDLVHRTIISRYDHRYLNEELPEFATEVPTTENLARQIELRLNQAWGNVFPGAWPRLRGIRIFETSNNIFEIVR